MLSNIFSDDYNKYRNRRNHIRSLVLQAKEKLKGFTILGESLDLSNPEDIIACLYLLSQDKESFGESLY